MDADMIEVTSFLRKYEGNVIHGSCKLSLATSLLHKINLAIQETEYNNVFLIPELSKKDDTFEFICNIINKVPKLMITQKLKSEKWRVDLSRFENLCYLELKNIPIHVVEGIKSLSRRLQVLICDNVSDSINDILGCSEVWEELQTVKLCCNEFGSLCTFTNTPWLQYLDLSYNRLKGKISLQTLNNLQHLNLSFNYLTSLPVLSEDSYSSLRVVIINNNHIEDVSAIHLFTALETVDVSYNMLAHHSLLASVVFLLNLQSINLSHNPISYHPYHRLHTCRHINASVDFRDFLLDGKRLTSKEKREIAQFGYFISDTCFPRYETNSSPIILNQSVNITVPKRKARDAVIKTCNTELNQNSLLISPKNNKHRLLPKNEYVEVYERVGGSPGDCEGFLSPSVPRIQYIMKFNFNLDNSKNQYNNRLTTILPGSIMNLKPTTKQLEFLEANRSIIELSIKSNENMLHSEGIESNSKSCDDLLMGDTKLYSLNSNFERKVQMSHSAFEKYKCEVNCTEKLDGDTHVSDDESTKTDENFDELLLAQKKLQDGVFLDVFIILDECEIREKSTIDGRTLVTWSLKSVESCENLTSNPCTIRLVFKTVRRESREIIYVMDYLDADKLLKKVRLFLESRSLQSMNQIAYYCLSCTSIFSQEFKRTVLSLTRVNGAESSEQKSTVKCLFCGSGLVVIEEDILHAKNENLFPAANLHSFSSAKTSYPKKNPVVEFRAARAGMSTAIMNIDGYDSDIEVLSNSTRSSVEVIEAQVELNYSNGHPLEGKESDICCRINNQSEDVIDIL